MSITFTIGGSSVNVQPGLVGTCTIESTINNRSIARFYVIDTAGTQHFQHGQPVTITDSLLGTLYTGYVNTSQELIFPPGPSIQHYVECMDQQYLADKRLNFTNYSGWMAGDIVLDLWKRYLQVEGVNIGGAISSCIAASDFGTGTLANVISTPNNSGDLELAPSGTAVMLTENTTSQFASGTLLSTAASGNSLSLLTSQAIKLTGFCASGYVAPYYYQQIWAGTYNVAAGDVLMFDEWVSGDSPQIMASVDAECADGTFLKDYFAVKSGNNFYVTDEHYFRLLGTTDISGFANDQWFSRSFSLNDVGNDGKVIKQVSVGLAGSSSGTYTAYFRNIKIMNGSTTKVTFFNASMNTNAPAANMGYSKISCQQITTYEKSGYRISSATSIAPAGIVQSSSITWNGITPDGTAVAVDTSFDGGATWQGATSAESIPDLLPGLTTTGISLQTRARLSLTGHYPDVTPLLLYCSWNVQPSYVATKTDVSKIYTTNTDWNTGTLSNITVANGDVQLNGVWRYWDDAVATNETTFSDDVNGNMRIQSGQETLLVTSNASGGNFALQRYDFAGTWSDFTLEIDVLVPDAASSCNNGVVYRTTTWNTTNDTYGYNAFVVSNSIAVHRGSSGGSGTTLQSATIAVQPGSWHRLKVVANGSSHKVYLDNVQFLSFTDATYSSGQVGGRFWNGDTSGSAGHTHTGYFDNFGIVSNFSGTWTSAATSIAPVGTVENSLIHWVADIPPEGALTVSTSTNRSTWTSATSGGTIPNFGPGVVVAGGTNLSIQAVLTLQTGAAQAFAGMDGTIYLTVILHGISWWMIGNYASVGTRSTAPLGIDTMSRSNVTGSWGTSFDGQTYTKTGTGTVNITSNEGLITSTTGDVHMTLGSVTALAEESVVRFSVSVAGTVAGLELLYQDANNFYRLSASTTTLSIVRMISGASATLASTSVSLTAGTFYWLRFRAIAGTSSSPSLLYGSVWQDGTLEPTTFMLQVSN